MPSLSFSVTLTAMANGVKETQRLAAPDLAGRTTLDSLLLEVDQGEKRASVYINCRLQGSVSMPWTPREMANNGGEELRVVSGQCYEGQLPHDVGGCRAGGHERSYLNDVC